MAIQILPGSHVDHGLSEDQLAWALGRVRELASPSGVTVSTVCLPAELGTVPCGLYGPAMGDEPVRDGHYQRRGDRPGESHVVVAPSRPTQRVTVIVGPHEGVDGLVLYTAFGGPAAPREPWDPSLDDAGRAASEAYWRDHALAVDAGAAS